MSRIDFEVGDQRLRRCGLETEALRILEDDAASRGIESMRLFATEEQSPTLQRIGYIRPEGAKPSQKGKLLMTKALNAVGCDLRKRHNFRTRLAFDVETKYTGDISGE